MGSQDIASLIVVLFGMGLFVSLIYVALRTLIDIPNRSVRFGKGVRCRHKKKPSNPRR
jgi:hypothetical protein